MFKNVSGEIRLCIAREGRPLHEFFSAFTSTLQQLLVKSYTNHGFGPILASPFTELVPSYAFAADGNAGQSDIPDIYLRHLGSQLGLQYRFNRPNYKGGICPFGELMTLPCVLQDLELIISFTIQSSLAFKGRSWG